MATPYEELTDEQLAAQIAELTSKVVSRPVSDVPAQPQISDAELQRQIQ